MKCDGISVLPIKIDRRFFRRLHSADNVGIDFHEKLSIPDKLRNHFSARYGGLSSKGMEENSIGSEESSREKRGENIRPVLPYEHDRN